jgi:excisionase family DNA binding protein
MTRGSAMGVPPLSGDRLLTVEDLAAFLRVPTQTIYQWRYRNQGPRALKAGTLLRYNIKDVLEWLEERAS